MDEREWMLCRDPRPMLHYLTHWNYAPRTAGKELISHRKLRLLAVAICRNERVSKLFVYRNMDGAIDAAEKFSDGIKDRFEYRDAVFEVGDISQCLSFEFVGAGNGGAARLNATIAELHRRVVPIEFIADLLRDMVDNPYAPVTLTKPPSRQAFSLARAAYEDRRPDWSLDPVRLAILADALEEEGCDCEELLQSLRGYSWPTSCDDCLGSGWIWYADINPEPSRKRDGRLYVSDRPNGMTWMVADRDSEPSEGTRCRTCVRGFVRRKLTHPRYRGQWALDLVLGKE